MKNAFTWTDGLWVCLRYNGIIYYSKDVKNKFFGENTESITYNVNKQNNTLNIKKIKNKDENNYKLTYINLGARSFIKKELNDNGYNLPSQSIRLIPSIKENKLIIDISPLK